MKIEVPECDSTFVISFREEKERGEKVQEGEREEVETSAVHKRKDI